MPPSSVSVNSMIEGSTLHLQRASDTTVAISVERPGRAHGLSMISSYSKHPMLRDSSPGIYRGRGAANPFVNLR